MIGQLTWPVARTSGLVAWALLAAATIWGLLVSSRLLERRPSPAWLLDLHRHLGWLTVVFTSVHLGALLLDDFVDFTPAELFVPLLSDHDTVPVAWGVIGLHLLVAVQSTSWLRSRLPLGVWRAIHWLSGPLFVVVTIHALLAGTDVSHPMVALPAAVITAELFLLALLRVGGRRSAPAPN